MKPHNFAETVRKNWPKTQGTVVAGTPPCIQVAADEVAHVERRLEAVALADAPALPAPRPGDSWFMAVLVCPDDDPDDLCALAAWASALPKTVGAAERIHFYLHEEARPTQLAPWRDAGLALTHVSDGFRAWGDLHKTLGWDLNVRVYDDFVGSGPGGAARPPA